MSEFKGLTRRLTVGILAAAALALAACGGPKQDTLHIYNWSDYIDPELLKEFAAETGIKVVYDTFDSNEVLETKVLTGGTGYDIVAPSNHNVPRYITAKAIGPLDFSQIPNRKNLWPDLMQRMEPFDPGGKYTVPYMWGTMGIGFNTGGGVKVSLAGPIRLRVDYRVFKLGSGALHSPTHRFYAGLNLKF